MVPRAIPISILFSLTAGAALYWIIVFFITEKDTGLQTYSELYPIIHKEIDKETAIINNYKESSKKIIAYSAVLKSVSDDVRFIHPPDPKIFKTDNSIPRLRNEYISFQDRLEIVRNKYYRYPNYNYPSDNTEYELTEIFHKVNDRFNNTLGYIWQWDSTVRYVQGISPEVQDQITALISDTARINQSIKQFSAEILEERNNLENLLISTKDQKDKAEDEIKRLKETIKQIDTSSKDWMMMYVVIPLFGLIVVLLTVIPLFYKNNPEILRTLFEEKIVLQIFTVFILVITILLLGIGNKINAEALGTLLGGISVYILQKSMGDNVSGSSAGKK